jgi:hypothetical protein
VSRPVPVVVAGRSRLVVVAAAEANMPISEHPRSFNWALSRGISSTAG